RATLRYLQLFPHEREFYRLADAHSPVQRKKQSDDKNRHLWPDTDRDPHRRDHGSRTTIRLTAPTAVFLGDVAAVEGQSRGSKSIAVAAAAGRSSNSAAHGSAGKSAGRRTTLAILAGRCPGRWLDELAKQPGGQSEQS